MKKFEQYCDKVSRLYPELHHIDYDGRILSQSVTFQVTDDCNLACCFVAGTKVLMANGSYKNIEDIVINDKVIAFDESGAYSSRNVDQFFFLYDEVETILFTDGTSITGTFNHEIFTTNGSKEIKDINVGDIILSYRGTKTVKDKIYIGEQPVFNIGVADLHTYVANDILTKNCYCYQVHKGKRRMSFETAKKFIDMIISGEKGMYEYINPIKSPGLVVDFIGGEPFMEIELIDQICTYLMDRLIELQHPWAMRTMFSICSNGVLYRDEKVQKFLSKWANRLSFSVTVDGNKELHDACRVFHDGSPSYDIAIDAVTDWMSRGYYMGSKITIAPENISFLYDAVKHMVELGYDEINANCVYEKGWTPVHATVLYDQMKRISDYFLDGNFDFEHHMYCSLYNEKFFHPKDENDLQPWCFRAGTKILTPDGNKNIEDLRVGDKVISGSGKVQTVENVMKRYSEDTCVINSTGVAPLYTTKDHPILAKKLIGFNQKYSEPKFVKSSGIKKKDRIGLHKFKLGSVHVDSGLAYIVGRYIGDGWDTHGDYMICCSYDEVDELAKTLKGAGIAFTEHDYPTVKQFNILRENKELLSILSDAGHLAHGKKIPKVVFSWDKESVEFLLKGLFDADGHYKEKEDTQCLNTVSSTLAEDVMTLLKALGYYPTIYFNKRAGKHTIQGREVNMRDRYEISFILNPDKKKGLRTKYDKENDMLWSTVRSVEDTEPYEVYNLTVSEDHTFIANGVIVHNCGGVGNSMIACDPDGVIFPCIRYMESSLGGDQVPYSIGDVDNGIAYNDCTKCRIKCMAKVDRRTQSTDECFYCPIAEGCSNCSAYDYQIHGTPDSRATFICVMHKARALANLYFWNKYYRKNNAPKRMKNYVPDEWALEIISQSELDMLKELSKEDY